MLYLILILDISVGYSTLQDGIPKTEGNGSATELLPQTHKEQVQQDFLGKMQDLPEETSLEQQEYLWVPKERLCWVSPEMPANMARVPAISKHKAFSDSSQMTPRITDARTRGKEARYLIDIMWQHCVAQVCLNQFPIRSPWVNA